MAGSDVWVRVGRSERMGGEESLSAVCQGGEHRREQAGAGRGRIGSVRRGLVGGSFFKATGG